MKSKTCCFTGHRNLPADKMDEILIRLDTAIDHLIAQGVTDFISGGALGFDQIAASCVIKKRQMGQPVRLIFALACLHQDEKWTQAQKTSYRKLLSKADEIILVSHKYTADCMKKRNQYLADHADCCICALLYARSGTSQTVQMAQRRGLQIMNVAG